MARPIRLIHFRALNFWAVIAGVSVIAVVAGMFAYDLGTAAGNGRDTAVVDTAAPTTPPPEARHAGLPLPIDGLTIQTKHDAFMGPTANIEAVLLQPTSPDVTPERVRSLAQYLYDMTATSESWDKQTNFVVAVYADAERAKRPSLALVRLTAGPFWDLEIITSEKQFLDLKTPPEEKLGLSEERRMAIYHRLQDAEENALADTEAAMPFLPNDNLEPGDEVTLSITVRLMLHNPNEYQHFTLEEAVASLEGGAALVPGTTLRIMSRAPDAGWPEKQAPYFVNAYNATGALCAKGWLNPHALMENKTKDGLGPHVYGRKRSDYEYEMYEKHRAALAATEGITADVLDQIGSEGVEKGWPY